jgi:hypothetical protein
VIEIDGTLQASATQPAVLSQNIALITVTGPLIASSTAQTNANESGFFPLISYRWYIKESAIETFFIEMRSSDIVGEIRPSRTLYVVEGATADSGKLPAASDVRSGVVYGFNDAGTGTCAVPPPTAVASRRPGRCDDGRGGAKAGRCGGDIRRNLGAGVNDLTQATVNRQKEVA